MASLLCHSAVPLMVSDLLLFSRPLRSLLSVVVSSPAQARYDYQRRDQYGALEV